MSSLGMARSLAAPVAEPAQAQFDAKSEQQQHGETGTLVRSWIEHWEMILEEVDLDLPEPLEELGPGTHAGEIEDAPVAPEELESMLGNDRTIAFAHPTSLVRFDTGYTPPLLIWPVVDAIGEATEGKALPNIGWPPAETA